MKNLLFLFLTIFSFYSCTKDTVRDGVTTVLVGTNTNIGSQTVDSYYIYSIDDVATLKSKYTDLGTIKNLYISSSNEINIDIPKLKTIENLTIYKDGKVTINNVTSITKLSNGYSSYCTDINLPDLVNLETVNLNMDKTANFNFPNVKKVKKVYIQCVDGTVVKDLHLDNIEEVTDSLEVYGSNTNVYLENLKTGNLKFSYINSLNGLSKVINLTGLELDYTNIEELNNSFLKSVNGNLKIYSNSKLKLLNLSNLESITGGLYISSNYELLSSSFENLKSIGKDSEEKGLYFYYNNKMTYLNLNKCESIQGKFEIQYNTALTEINFPILTTINKRMSLYNVDKAIKFNFPMLTNISNDLEMYSNDSVTTINFDSLKTVGNSLIYKSNYTNTELKFPLLETIGMGIELTSNYYLKTLELNKVTTTKYLTIKSNSYLNNISLKGLTNVDTIIDISGNESPAIVYLNSNLVAGQSKTVEGTVIN